MELNAGRELDEACNSYNDVYCDEVLYAAWIETPRMETVQDGVVASANDETAAIDVTGFMSRLYACQE
jgi:hypothetical protein